MSRPPITYGAGSTDRPIRISIARVRGLTSRAAARASILRWLMGSMSCVLALGNDGHRRVQGGGTGERNRREFGQQVGAGERIGAQDVADHVEDGDPVGGHDKKDQEAGGGPMGAPQEPHPDDHRRRDERGVEEGSRDHGVLLAQDDVRGEAEGPDQHPGPRREDGSVKVRGPLATRDTTADEHEEAAETGHVARRGQGLGKDPHVAGLGQHTDPDRCEQDAEGDELPGQVSGRVVDPDADEDDHGAAKAHCGDQGLERLLVTGEGTCEGPDQADDEERPATRARAAVQEPLWSTANGGSAANSGPSIAMSPKFWLWGGGWLWPLRMRICDLPLGASALQPAGGGPSGRRCEG